jgi:hypothetical protein
MLGEVCDVEVHVVISGTLRYSYETSGNMKYSLVAFYARFAFLKTSHNLRPSFETHNEILAEFVRIRIISNFAHEVKFY